MVFAGYLTNSQLNALTEAAVTGGLTDVPRVTLLAGIPPVFAGSLQILGDPISQFSSDLTRINGVQRMVGNLVPLVPFLENCATQLRFRSREEASVFQDALSKVSNLVGGVPVALPATATLPEIIANEQIIGNDDSVDITFLAMGIEMAKAVARISVPRFEAGTQIMLSPGAPWVLRGTAWVVAPDLALTNRHVINARNADEAPAGDADLRSQALGATLAFGFDGKNATTADATVSDLLATSEELDYALLAIAGQPNLPIPRLDAKSVVLNSTSRMAVNIIQHPRGEPKQVAFRNNLVSGADDLTLRYFTDTDYGSSGSPVCDDQWRVVALHRGARHVTDTMYQGKTEAFVNFGSQIQAVLADIANQAPDAAARIAAAQGAGHQAPGG